MSDDRPSAGTAQISLDAALDAVERVEKEKLASTLVSKTPKQAVKETTGDLRAEFEELAVQSGENADEILADCPDCELGNLKAERAGLDGEERILRCSYVECGRVIKSYQDEWPDYVSPHVGGRHV